MAHDVYYADASLAGYRDHAAYDDDAAGDGRFLSYAHPDDQAHPYARDYGRIWPATLIGAIWGTLMTIGNNLFDYGQYKQGAILLLAACLLMVYFRSTRPLFAVLTDRGGLLMALHGMAAVLSMVTNNLHVMVVRYLMLVLAFSLMLAVRGGGPQVVAAVRRGLTWGGFIVAVTIMPSLRNGDLLNPLFRVGDYLNPNALGLIVAMTALSMIEFLHSRWARRDRGMSTYLLLVATVLVLMVLFATKSRTAAVVFLAGLVVFTFLRGKPWMVAALVLLGIPAVIVGQSLLSGFGQSISQVYRLDGSGGRDLSTLTGRTENWMMGIEELWLPNPVLGAGPGSVAQHLGVIHSGYLYNLCEVGLLGTLPLVLIVIMAFASSIRNRRDRSLHFAISIFAAGLVSSIAEPSLFSIGSAGSLLFILSTVVLLRPPRPDAPAGNPLWYSENGQAQFEAAHAEEQYGYGYDDGSGYGDPQPAGHHYAGR